jgi:ribosome biogenesis GTPase
LIVTSLNRDFNPRRVERYLAMVHQGGVRPVVVLSKADLVDGTEDATRQMSDAAPGAPVLVLSALRGDGLEALREYLAPGRTVVLVGSSGVGKSTLANALLGREAQAVRDIRADDDRGRHTTTGRELFPLPGGALLIDTPGLRELGLADPEGALDAVFGEIEALAPDCRFADCRHEQEPGCAVKAAVESCALPPGRYEGYLKLKREAAFRATEVDPAEARRRKARDKQLGRLIKQIQDKKRK